MRQGREMGGRDGREGPSTHWSEWDISRFCAVLIMGHEATQTPPIGRCHTAALPNMQPSAPCKYQPTVQVYKTMSPHQRQQCHPQKHPPESAHHLDVNQAQLMLQLGQVLHYAMLCIFPDLPRCVLFPSSCSKQLTLPPPCNSQDLHMYR